MIIIQLDSDQLKNLIKNSVRTVLTEHSFTNHSEGDQFLTVKEAATFLNLAPQTLYGFTSNRTIPFNKKGKKLYFKKSDLEKWLSDGRKKTLDELETDLNNKEKGGKHG